MRGSDIWKEAVIEACIVHCIDWDEADPVKTLNNLLRWNAEMALDPAISYEAQELINRGRLSSQQPDALPVPPTQPTYP